MQELENKYGEKLKELLIYFFMYSFLGWVLETLYSYIVLGHFTNRGFLVGPICPIYGLGMIILITYLSKYKTNYIKLFISSAVVLTLFEYATSYFLEAQYGIKCWDYTNDLYNLNGRVCLPYSIAWGLAAIIFIGYIHKYITKFVSFVNSKIPNQVLESFLKILLIILIIDIILSELQYVHVIQ